MTLLVLPPSVTCRKSLLPDGGIAYRLCHYSLGVIGTVCLVVGAEHAPPRVEVEWPDGDARAVTDQAQALVMQFARELARVAGTRAAGSPDALEAEEAPCT